MELELWAELSQAVCALAGKIMRVPRDRHDTASIVRVHLWSVLHDRPTVWACDRRNWTARTRPPQLPDQSTMSRRMRRDDFAAFLQRLGERLKGKAVATLLKRVDGKPLELPNHSSDRDARWGRGVSRQSLGYKLHAVFSSRCMPDAFVITPLDVCEKQMAARMLKRLGGGGYLLGDAHYDASWLHDVSRRHGHQLLAPRACPGKGLGHHYQSPHRLRALELLEAPACNDFGRDLHHRRGGIERDFAGLSSFGCGLGPLPSWVRRIRRVRRWVIAKLLINAARLRINQARQVDA